MTINSSAGELAVALQYARYGDGAPVPLTAYGKVTFSSQPNADDTVAVGGVTYTFKSSLAATGQVKIGATLRETIKNLAGAINGDPDYSGTGYYAGTAQALLAKASAGDTVLYVDAFFDGTLGNAVTLAIGGSGVGTRLAVSGSSLAGGLNGGKAVAAKGRVGFSTNPADTDTITVGTVSYEFTATIDDDDQVLIGSTIAESIANFVAAINGADGSGTVYSANLTANAAASAEALFGTVVLTAAATGTSGNSAVLSESETSLTVTGSGTLQNGRAASEFKYGQLSFKRLPTTQIDYAEMQMQDVFPPEINGLLSPTGAYKSGVAVGGGADLIPRLENSIGDLLLAALGSAGVSVASVVGTHTFKFDQSNVSSQPWIAVRRKVPGRENIPGQGLIGFDNKVASLRIQVNAASLMTARVDFMGRVPTLDDHPEAWSGVAMEDFKSAPLACKGVFRFPTIPEYAESFKVVQAAFTLSNTVTTPREEMVVGSYFMDDVITRYRTLTVEVVYKYEGPTIYKYLFGGAADATEWNPKPFTTVTDGSDYAFEARFEAPFDIPSSASIPFSLTIRANQVTWLPQRPIVMQGAGIILQPITGTVLIPENTSDPYAEFILKNGKTSAYSLPSES